MVVGINIAFNDDNNNNNKKKCSHNFHIQTKKNKHKHEKNKTKPEQCWMEKKVLKIKIKKTLKTRNLTITSLFLQNAYNTHAEKFF